MPGNASHAACAGSRSTTTATAQVNHSGNRAVDVDIDDAELAAMELDIAEQLESLADDLPVDPGASTASAGSRSTHRNGKSRDNSAIRPVSSSASKPPVLSETLPRRSNQGKPSNSRPAKIVRLDESDDEDQLALLMLEEQEARSNGGSSSSKGKTRADQSKSRQSRWDSQVGTTTTAGSRSAPKTEGLPSSTQAGNVAGASTRLAASASAQAPPAKRPYAHDSSESIGELVD